MTSLQLVTTPDEMVDGKYELLDVIGSGGVGTVYRARHVWTEREVAVKVLHKGLPHLRELQAAFLREARAAVQLRHPNVVDVLDMGKDEHGTTYLVMELLAGPTLREVLDARGTLSAEETIVVLRPLIDALEKAHQVGIVHKDFKPENIILDSGVDGSVVPKLLDFGVAQILRDNGPHGSSAREAVLIGTPQYMSPEQVRAEGHRVGPHSDVWGIGIVWYECLTGRCPFDGDTHEEALDAVIHGHLDLGELPEAHAGLLAGMLQRRIDDRTPSLSALRDSMVRDGLLTQSIHEESATFRIATSSARPSRILDTLHGVGPVERQQLAAPTAPAAPAVPAAMPAAPPSAAEEVAVEPLPRKTTVNATLLGLVAVVVVGLAAWWGIGRGAAAPDSASTAPAVAIELTPEPEPEPEPEMEDRDSTPVEPVEPDESEPTLAIDEPAPETTESPAPLAAPEPRAEKRSTARRPTAKRTAAKQAATKERRAEQPPSATEPPVEKAVASKTEPAEPRRVDEPPVTNEAYERPPDLVTQW